MSDKADKPASLSGIWIDLPAGRHLWCRCSKSATQPLCDGSHAGTPFKPLAFELSHAQRLILCACKNTKNPPYCDGSHAGAAVEPDAGFDEYL